MEWFRSGLPNFVVVLHDIVLNDQIVKGREISEIVSIITEHVVALLKKNRSTMVGTG